MQLSDAQGVVHHLQDAEGDPDDLVHAATADDLAW